MKRPPRHLRRMSARRRAQTIEYHKKRRWFLAAHPWCEFYLRQTPPQHIRATQIHHTRGRAGTLYLDERFWVAVSVSGHNWIHEPVPGRVDQARKLGLLCVAGQWNTPQPISDSGADTQGTRSAAFFNSSALAPTNDPAQPLSGN